jgi:lipid A 3-O-deacylase
MVREEIKTARPLSISNSCLVVSARNTKMPYGIISFGHGCISAAISTNGGTNLAYAGLTWEVFLTRRLFVEGAFGLSIHDGPDNDFGCSVNFRESGSVGVMLSDRWDIMATVDHMSNANLRDENRGLTTVGLRLGRKF